MGNPTTQFSILAKLKHLLAGHIYLYQALDQIVSTMFSQFIDTAISALFDFITRPVMKKNESIVSSITK